MKNKFELVDCNLCGKSIRKNGLFSHQTMHNTSVQDSIFRKENITAISAVMNDLSGKTKKELKG